MNCSSCNAKIGADAISCPYCGQETPLAVVARANAAAQQRSLEANARAAAQNARAQVARSVEGSAKVAFYWVLASFPLCCLPIPSAIGVYLAFRARGLASSQGLVAPWQAMAAIIGGFVSMALFVLLLIVGVVSEQERSARVAELHTRFDAKIAAETLDSDTACALIELALLEGGAGQKRSSVAIFHCENDVVAGPKSALMKAVEYSPNTSDAPLKVDACFSRGKRWKVEAIGKKIACDVAVGG